MTGLSAWVAAGVLAGIALALWSGVEGVPAWALCIVLAVFAALVARGLASRS